MNWTPNQIAVRNKLIETFPGLFDLALQFRFAVNTLSRWRRTGMELPFPNFLKRCLLKRFAVDHQLEILVETGTALGDTPWVFRNSFKEIYTIELSETLAKLARNRFAKFDHIQVLQGDSGSVLPGLIPRLSAPILFWLDGHYSGGLTAQGSLNSPIVKEVHAIADLCRERFVILIDDARIFGLESGYPALDDFIPLLQNILPDHSVAVSNDIISAVPMGKNKSGVQKLQSGMVGFRSVDGDSPAPAR